MFDLPAGWRLTFEADHLRLVHPAGPDVATLTYFERLRPLVKAGAIMRRYLAEHPDFACKELPDCVERTLTAEGEFAGIATLAGAERGLPVQHDLGFVFGDDFYTRLAITCRRPEHFEQMTELARELVRVDTLMLGVRRRRFEYSPPRGWQPIVRGLVTDWLPPDYPHDKTYLTVYPASLPVIAPNRLLASMLGIRRDDLEVLHERIVPVMLPSGLGGELGQSVLAASDGRVAKVCVVLHDDRYLYALELVTNHEKVLAKHREQIDDVFASVQPIGGPTERVHDHDFSALDHWSD